LQQKKEIFFLFVFLFLLAFAYDKTNDLAALIYCTRTQGQMIVGRTHTHTHVHVFNLVQ